MKIFIGILLIGVVFAKPKKCGKHAHFEKCGTACPVTCDNPDNSTDACIAMCVSGCQCIEGFVKTRSGHCVKPEKCPKAENNVPESCFGWADRGLCRARITMWYFDQASGTCEQFVYGGCGGNGNRYITEEECVEKCKVPADAERANICGENESYNRCGTACPLTCENYDDPPTECPDRCLIGCECEEGFVRTADETCVKSEECPKKQNENEEIDCTAPVDPGVGVDFSSRFYYDAAEESCKEFVYGGSGGNTNNFESEEECKTICGALLTKSRSACMEDKEVGSCEASLERFFYNNQTSQCESFIYGGCERNSNNFNSKEDCEAVCIN